MADEAINFQLASSSQLDVIDKLRDIGVGDLVALPQLVVVGDQSSGKSSVLEGISGLPFARDSGLCTRFATQITLRRTSLTSIAVSIVPHSQSNVTNVDLEKFKAFKQDDLKSLSGDSFTKVFKEACQVMGVSSGAGPPEPGQTTFSRHTFKVELSGPDRENLSIIDIPGIFRNPTPGVTTMEDIKLVDDLVRSYIRDERTIILCVLPSNVDIATQGILSMANEADPHGIRTIGVLTKPDLVDVEGGAHKQVLNLVEGTGGLKLSLGFYVIRNRGQNETGPEAAIKELELFQRDPWHVLDKKFVGNDALKERLQERLQYITKKELPAVKKEINKKLKTARERLLRLGEARDTSDQQRVYLQRIAIDFQKITDHALDVYYERDEVFETNPKLRLPTIVVDRSERFSDDLAKTGHTVTFRQVEDEHDDEKNDGVVVVVEQHDSSPFLDDLKREVFPELDELLPTSKIVDLKISDEDANKWIEKEFRRSRGMDLGSVGPSVLPRLWNQQSKNWETISRHYVSDIILTVHEYIHFLMEHVCPDETTREPLLLLLKDLVIKKYEVALSTAEFILQCERAGTMLTHNHYFSDTFQRLANDRIEKSMNKHIIACQSQGEQWHCCTSSCKVIPISAVAEITNMTNTERSVLDLHAVLKAYYKVARKRFVDVLCMQVTDHHLLKGADGPLRIFSPLFVSTLTSEQLEAIAGEDHTSKRLRKSLIQEIKALEEGRRLL